MSSVNFEDQLFDNVMMTSWDLKERKAYVITKRSFKEEQMPFRTNLDVATISAANPKYFKPVMWGNDHAFIGGDTVALSPAFLAYMHATDIENKDPATI